MHGDPGEPGKDAHRVDRLRAPLGVDREQGVVDPACRRAGLGSELLAQTRRNLGGGVKSLSAGSGAGPYFWPGVPEDAPDGWAFLRAHGFEPTGEMADLLADITRFRPPEWVLGRAGGGVRFELAAKGDAAEVIALQERHFPAWTAFYEDQLTLPGTVLVARADGRIVGRVRSRAQPSVTSCGGHWSGAPWGRSGVWAWTRLRVSVG